MMRKKLKITFMIAAVILLVVSFIKSLLNSIATNLPYDDADDESSIFEDADIEKEFEIDS